VAARSDAATDRVTLSSAPSMAAITVCGWARIEAASASSFNPIIRFYTNSGDASSWIVGFKGANGRTPSVYSPGNTSGISAAEQALSTYVFIAATLSGTSAQLLYGNTPGSLTKVTGTVAASGTPDRLTFFGRSAADGSEWLNGTLAYWRIWTAVLSDAEIAAESQSTTPVRSTNAWANWAFAAAALTDTVASRNLTAGTTALSSAADPSLSTTIAGNGTATAQQATSAGTGGPTVAGTGTATAQQATAAGSGGATVAGTGAVTAQQATSTGAGGAIVAGSGTATAQPATAAGAGGAIVAGAGAAAASPGVGAGSGAAVVAGTGAAAPLPATSAGAGGATVAGNAAASVQSAVSAGAGGVEVAASGTATAPPAESVGAGGSATAVAGSGTAVAAPASAAGLGGVVIAGSGTAVAPAAHSQGSPAAGDGSLLLQVGEGRPVEWLEPTEPEVVSLVVTGAPVPVSWLVPGAGRPA